MKKDIIITVLAIALFIVFGSIVNAIAPPAIIRLLGAVIGISGGIVSLYMMFSIEE